MPTVRNGVAEAAPPDSSSAAPEPAAAASVPDLPPPISPSRVARTVSYPEKFHLALKYAQEGPPLPNLSDADRILLEALQQQAQSGECNKARPGMWDSAEEKAKYDAWKKLGTMSKAEAMHLYVQVTEASREYLILSSPVLPHSAQSRSIPFHPVPSHSMPSHSSSPSRLIPSIPTNLPEWPGHRGL